MVDVAGSVGGVVSPVLQVAEWLAAPIWRQFKYLFNYKSSFDNLQREVDKLKTTRDEVQGKVSAAERNVEEIRQNVKDWQKDVEKIITKGEQMIQEKANDPRCFKGLCPNFITRYKQSKKAFKLKRDDIDPLLQQVKELGPVSCPTNPPEIWLRSSENYLAFESRNSTLKNVWDALKDKNVFMIGVYGMGGLGKTTLVEEIGRKAEKDKLFEDIVFVEVSESPDSMKIQKTIAKKLGLEFKNENKLQVSESPDEMANKIYSRMKDKNILLILDNIWEDLEFEKTIGIPCGADRGRNKLLFTTRNLDVLERMGSTNNFGMGILNEEEAWTLFTKMTGNVIQTRELHSLPNDVCKECGGLPIIICTIAKALRNKSSRFDWKYALQELRTPSLAKYARSLEKDYMKIALSYKYLRDDELKKTFLISSLMENNTSISNLLKHVVCLHILEGVNLTMEDARDRLEKLVHDLKDACLLLNGVKSGQFAMHDVVRTIAITIAYVDHHVFTMRNDIERDWKDRDKLMKCTKISLTGGGTIISQLLPNDLNCPDLEYFSMSNMYNLSFKIPNNLFSMMLKLKVLNLVGLQQSSLPSSIRFLTNLQTLCLDYSDVEDFAIIGKLKTLKVLSLRKLYIEEFPLEWGQLTQLRLLDLSGCWGLKVIAPNLISQLSQLEEFYTKESAIKWEHEVLEELKLLSNLTSLELDVEDNNMLPKDFFSKELKRYKITIGCWFGKDSIRKYQGEKLRILELKYNSTISLEEFCEIKNVEVLCIAKSSNDAKDPDEMQILPLFNEKVIFTDLMALKLISISFGKIWESQPSTSFYRNLTQLILEKCDKIKYVFSFFIAKSLEQLKYLLIEDCKALEKIIEKEGAETVNFIFPRITELELRYLPKLTIFCQGVDALEFPILKTLKITNCSNFILRYQDFKDNNDEGEVQDSKSKSIYLHKVIFTNLMVLELVNISFGKIWESQLSTSSYQNLTQLILKKCNKIKYVFPFSIAKSLQQLQYLKIEDCKVLEKIVEEEEEGAKVVNSIFPQLTKLELRDLPELTVFYLGVHALELPMLKTLKISCCPNFISTYQSFQDNNEEGEVQVSEPKSVCLEHKINSDLKVFELEDYVRTVTWERQSKTLITSLGKFSVKLLQKFDNLKVLKVSWSESKEFKIPFGLPYLEVLDIDDCHILMSLPTFSAYFLNLKVLQLSDCDGLIRRLITPSMAKSLVQLTEMSISNCNFLTEVVEDEDDATTTDNGFQNLKKLSLKRLDGLICFCSGNYSFNFSSLEELIIEECPRMKTFCPGILSTPKLHNINYEMELVEIGENDLNTSIQRAHKKWVNSGLSYLSLSGRDIMSIWQGELERFDKTETLRLIKDEYAHIPIHILQKFINLKFLVLEVSSYEELFSCREGEEHVEALAKLEKLNLGGLFNLKYIWKQDFRLKSILENLRTLQVKYCHNLITLLPPSSTFENLSFLSVTCCNGMQNLMTSSIVKSLVCLRDLSITGCEMMVEVLANERKIEKDEIVFENLRKLSLCDLESLTCFGSGNYILNFPFLESLFVSECSKMRTFFAGGLNLPSLWMVNDKNRSSELNWVTQHLKNDCSKLWELCERLPWSFESLVGNSGDSLEVSSSIGLRGLS